MQPKCQTPGTYKRKQDRTDEGGLENLDNVRLEERLEKLEGEEVLKNQEGENLSDY